jgi:hypothetical protein
VIQMRQQRLVLIGGDHQLELGFAGEGSAQHWVGAFCSGVGIAVQRRLLFGSAPDGQVALDASLRIQHQVPCAGVGKQIVDRIGDHAAQPAEAVLPAHAHAAQPSQVVQRGALGQCGCFPARLVKLTWGQHSTVGTDLAGGKFVRLGRALQLFGQWRRCIGLHQAGFRHRGTFLRLGVVFSGSTSRLTAS